jgi:protein O-GlcNAc transferase
MYTRAGRREAALAAYQTAIAIKPDFADAEVTLSHWYPIADLSDTALAKKIGSDGIDILIDLSGHTSDNRLLTFACKPAPVQASWIGYPAPPA